MRRPSSRRGSSLIIVLAFVALLAGVVVAFLARTALTAQSSASSANGVRADLFCKGAAETVIGDLKQEIAAGSTVVTVGGTNVYLPLGATGARQNGAPWPVLGGYASSLNLVKESLSGQPFYAGTTYDTGNYPAPDRASPSVSTNLSVNGRSVSPARWNKALLLPKKNPGSDTDLTPTADFAPPAWIYVARDGSNPKAYAAAMSQAANSNAGFAVGRYAYAVYDESGLLDMNAAGYPTGTTAAQVGGKGTLGLADLTQVGLAQSDIDALVGWRNYASAQPGGGFPSYAFTAGAALNYFNYLFGIKAGTLVPAPSTGTTTTWTGARRTGFLTAGNTALYNGQTDRLFGSRQELIRMLVHDVARNAADRERVQAALPYLGTFSREVNSPSWMPVTPTGSAIAYATKALAQAKSAAAPGAAPANQEAATVILTAAQAGFARADGTTAQAGEPLLKERFPLRRLEWFNAANQAAYAADIRKRFAMQKRADGTWDYVDPDSGSVVAGIPTIKTLDQVAAARREPTFWEVLKAAILSGSLGVGHGQDVGGPTASDLDATRQLLQIGLNIIDQYNSNPGPTVLLLGAAAPSTANLDGTLPIAGVKNFPYILEIGDEEFQATLPPYGLSTTTDDHVCYFGFVLWNPLQNASTAANRFRIVANGQCYFSITPTTGSGFYQSPVTTHANTALTFQTTAARNFQTISPLQAGDAVVSACDANALYPPGSATPAQAALFVGHVSLPKGTPPSSMQSILPNFPGGTPMLFTLEWSDGTHWIPYQTFALDTAYGNAASQNPAVYTNDTTTLNAGGFGAPIIHVHSDPRTFRLGMMSSSTGTPALGSSRTMRTSSWDLADANGAPFPFTATGHGTTGPIKPPFQVTPAGAPLYLADLAFNSTTSASGQQYTDGGGAATDNVVRAADGNTSLAFAQGSPFANAVTPGGAAPARPLFLGRSFNSVAEMGYAFRDEPWKTLNFFSSDSADAALLDFFSLSENSLRAGTVNVNAASPQVLAALFNGALQDAADNASALAGTPSSGPAPALRAYLGATRLNPPHAAYDLSDIAPLAAALSAQIPGTATMPGGLKRVRETAARALADAWNTRTWNLLIDVVAQTGRFPATASTLDDFSVDGERRLWVHVALDRFTGQVVDIQIEPVTE